MSDSSVNNLEIYNQNWESWFDMQKYGPGNRWHRALIQDILQKNIEPQAITRILDIGCGEGTKTHLLSTLFKTAHVTGIDFSSSGIAVANKHYASTRLEFLCDPESQQLNQTAFDLISAFEVLEHLDDWQTTLARMAKSTKQYLLLSYPCGRMRPYEANMGHVRNFQKGQVEYFLKQKHFEPVQTFYAGWPFYSPFYRELCQLTNSGNNTFSKGTFGWQQKLVSQIFFTLFRYFSTKQNHGDQFVGLFRKIPVLDLNGR